MSNWKRGGAVITADDFVVDQDKLREELEVVARLYRLRKARRIGVVLADWGRYWIAESDADAEGTKVRYSLRKLKELCDQLEAADRKGPASETRIGDTQEERTA